jgi:hypothetical protein
MTLFRSQRQCARRAPALELGVRFCEGEIAAEY